ncbi:TRAP transporter small permease [Aestuariibacter sp. AA17]|uniref:TRAP transporter small permease protein n=1 Tax=Fluctibacter corallii TaxID=2984329 RepID=A0ABT3A5B7_9ALTE|nr:TRAP transporter small permease [Aestuariibacter sp. AA17]MCV2883813.1 TRAP transporter small permease [Aestuariibacter sp. AA17]
MRLNKKHRSLTHFLVLLARIEDALLIITMLALLILASAQVLLRNVFDVGVPWISPLSNVLVLWLAFLASGIATRERNHLAIDLRHYFPIYLQRISGGLVDIVAGAVCGFVAWHSVELIRYEFEDGLLAFASVPMWLTEMIIPLGFALMAIRFAMSAVQHCFSQPNSEERT